MDGLKPYIPAATKVSFNGMRYHVFLSFRGKDVRKTLVDHLFQALSAAGLNVFLDSDKLKKGEIIDLSLENAIKSSAICIPIFSKGYASSAWCLREAALMLASPSLIIPLFYEMEPTHVRYPERESSPYKKSFEKHCSHIPDRYSREEIDGWKDALEQICSRSGWSLDMTAGFEGRLVKKVVNDIIKTLDRVPLQVAKYPVFSKEESSFNTETRSAPVISTETRSAPVTSTETRSATECCSFFMGTSAPVFSTEESSLPLDSKNLYELLRLESLSETRSAPVISTERRSATAFSPFFTERSAPVFSTKEPSLPWDLDSLYELIRQHNIEL